MKAEEYEGEIKQKYEDPFKMHEIIHLRTGQGCIIKQDGENIASIRPLAERGDYCLYVFDRDNIGDVFNYVVENFQFKELVSLKSQLEELDLDLENHDVFRAGIYERGVSSGSK